MKFAPNSEALVPRHPKVISLSVVGNRGSILFFIADTRRAGAALTVQSSVLTSDIRVVVRASLRSAGAVMHCEGDSSAVKP